MTARKTLRSELDELRAEMARLREASAASSAHAEPREEHEEPASASIREQIAELNRMVLQMIEDAEEAINDHPVATVAGALALGIVIGRLTAR